MDEKLTGKGKKRKRSFKNSPENKVVKKKQKLTPINNLLTQNAQLPAQIILSEANTQGAVQQPNLKEIGAPVEHSLQNALSFSKLKKLSPPLTRSKARQLNTKPNAQEITKNVKNSEENVKKLEKIKEKENEQDPLKNLGKSNQPKKLEKNSPEKSIKTQKRGRKSTKNKKSNPQLDFFVLKESKKQKNKKKIKEIVEEESKTFNKILNDQKNEKKKDLHPFFKSSSHLQEQNSISAKNKKNLENPQKIDENKKNSEKKSFKIENAMKSIHVLQQPENWENIGEKVNFLNFNIDFFDDIYNTNEENENSYFSKIPEDDDFHFSFLNVEERSKCPTPVSLIDNNPKTHDKNSQKLEKLKEIQKIFQKNYPGGWNGDKQQDQQETSEIRIFFSEFEKMKENYEKYYEKKRDKATRVVGSAGSELWIEKYKPSQFSVFNSVFMEANQLNSLFSWLFSWKNRDKISKNQQNKGRKKKMGGKWGGVDGEGRRGRGYLIEYHSHSSHYSLFSFVLFLLKYLRFHVIDVNPFDLRNNKLFLNLKEATQSHHLNIHTSSSSFNALTSPLLSPTPLLPSSQSSASSSQQSTVSSSSSRLPVSRSASVSTPFSLDVRNPSDGDEDAEEMEQEDEGEEDEEEAEEEEAENLSKLELIHEILSGHYNEEVDTEEDTDEEEEHTPSVEGKEIQKPLDPEEFLKLLESIGVGESPPSHSSSSKTKAKESRNEETKEEAKSKEYEDDIIIINPPHTQQSKEKPGQGQGRPVQGLGTLTHAQEAHENQKDAKGGQEAEEEEKEEAEEKIIVFNDIEIRYEDEHQFYTKLLEFIEESKKPILLLCKKLPEELKNLMENQKMPVSLVKMPQNPNPAKKNDKKIQERKFLIKFHFFMVFLKEINFLLKFEEIEKICEFFSFDLRKISLNLQFFSLKFDNSENLFEKICGISARKEFRNLCIGNFQFFNFSDLIYCKMIQNSNFVEFSEFYLEKNSEKIQKIQEKKIDDPKQAELENKQFNLSFLKETDKYLRGVSDFDVLTRNLQDYHEDLRLLGADCKVNSETGCFYPPVDFKSFSESLKSQNFLFSHKQRVPDDLEMEFFHFEKSVMAFLSLFLHSHFEGNGKHLLRLLEIDLPSSLFSSYFPSFPISRPFFLPSLSFPFSFFQPTAKCKSRRTWSRG